MRLLMGVGTPCLRPRCTMHPLMCSISVRGRRARKSSHMEECQEWSSSTRHTDSISQRASLTSRSMRPIAANSHGRYRYDHGLTETPAAARATMHVRCSTRSVGLHGTSRKPRSLYKVNALGGWPEGLALTSDIVTMALAHAHVAPSCLRHSVYGS